MDAEQTWYQPAIHHFTLHYLMPQFNTSTSTPIYNTVQAYLQSAQRTLQLDAAVAKLYNFKYALKLVRGAYMVQERAEAAANGYPSPVHPDKSSTDQSYNKALEYLLGEVARGTVNLMVASHNRPSVELAVKKMGELNLSPSNGSVVFGQLLGMADHLTYPLAHEGYLANKILPYGPIQEVLPYLSRRAQENRGIMQNAQTELGLYQDELKRRLLGGYRSN